MRFFILVWVIFISGTLSAKTTMPVNSIIGDQGYEFFFNEAPTELTSNNVRVQTHLLYAAMLLYTADVKHLSAEKKKKRFKLIQHLFNYALNGKFPKNKDYPNMRKPCFIDDEATICAVGYSVEKSSDRATAEAINKDYKYAEVMEMDTLSMSNWAQENGLTLKECAIVQPAYEGFYFEPNRYASFTIGAAARGVEELYSQFGLNFHWSKFDGRRFFAQQLVGIQYTPLRNQNHSLVARYSTVIKTVGRISLNAGVGVEQFWTANATGTNARPEFNLGYSAYKKKMYFLAKLGYAYHLGISNTALYPVNRNEVVAKIGLGWKI